MTPALLLLLSLACARDGGDTGSAAATGFGTEYSRIEMPPAAAVWVDGPRAWGCAGGSGVYIVDISDPLRPDLGEVLELDCHAIAGESGRIYVAAGAGGLAAVHPGELRVLGSYVPDFPVTTLAVDAGNGAAFIAGTTPAGAVGLEKVWTYDAEHLAQARRVDLDAGLPLAVGLDEAGVVLARDDGRVQLLAVALDVRSELSLAPLPGRAGRGLLLADGVLWLAQGAQGLAAWDITDLDAPVALPGWSGGAAYGLALLDDRLYVGGDEALTVLDVSEPQAVREVGVAPLDGLLRPEGIHVAQGAAMVVDAAAGAMVVVDVDESTL